MKNVGLIQKGTGGGGGSDCETKEAVFCESRQRQSNTAAALTAYRCITTGIHLAIFKTENYTFALFGMTRNRDLE